MTSILSLIARLLRGVRLLEFVTLVLLLVMVLGVYLEKASAGRERGEIVAVQSEIDAEARRQRLLQAEVAHLEEPIRLEQLSAQLGLGPTQARQEGDVRQLALIASGALTAQAGHGAGSQGDAAASGQTGALR
jgi:hypothetical protein